jgi:hypothetical protein
MLLYDWSSFRPSCPTWKTRGLVLVPIGGTIDGLDKHSLADDAERPSDRPEAFMDVGYLKFGHLEEVAGLTLVRVFGAWAIVNSTYFIVQCRRISDHSLWVVFVHC